MKRLSGRLPLPPKEKEKDPPLSQSRGGGGGLIYETDGDARRLA